MTHKRWGGSPPSRFRKPPARTKHVVRVQRLARGTGGGAPALTAIAEPCIKELHTWGKPACLRTVRGALDVAALCNEIVALQMVAWGRGVYATGDSLHTRSSPRGCRRGVPSSARCAPLLALHASWPRTGDSGPAAMVTLRAPGSARADYLADPRRPPWRHHGHDWVGTQARHCPPSPSGAALARLALVLVNEGQATPTAETLPSPQLHIPPAPGRVCERDPLGDHDGGGGGGAE